MEFRSSIRTSRSRRNALFSKIFSRPALALAVLALIPVYPSFGSYLSGTALPVAESYTPDETSIIDSYNGEDFDALAAANVGFVDLENFVDKGRDLRGSKPVTYVVRSGDSLSTIADQFNVSINTVLWSNGLTINSVLHPGMKLKVPPMSGIVYSVAKGDTVAAIAKKYSVDEETIRRQNNLIASQDLALGTELIIPGGKKPVEKKSAPVAKAAKKVYDFTKATRHAVEAVVNADGYELERVSSGKGFVWGNCTYFVARYANVTWRGNAKDWLKNAAAAGVSTGSQPQAGAIVVLHGKGYNPRYGHVGIVVEVDGDDIIVKDMNFRRLNEVTTRKISADNGAIKGYIYPE